MEIRRRDILAGMGLGLLAPPVRASPKRLRAIAFDAFVLFDPRPLAGAARAALGDSGAALTAAWFPKLFGYTWLLTAAERYVPFDQLAERALVATARGLDIELSPSSRSSIVGGLSALRPWPDVAAGLAELRTAGLRLCVLSNLPESLLVANLETAQLASMFDAVLSTDRVQRFKPAPVAYHLAPRVLSMDVAEIGFAAFAGWDAVGATWFGYRTAWVNRAMARSEQLEITPEVTSAGMTGVLRLAGLR